MKFRLIILLLLSALLASCGQYGALYLPGNQKSKADNPKNPSSIQSSVESNNPATTGGLNPNSVPPVVPGQSVQQ